MADSQDLLTAVHHPMRRSILRVMLAQDEPLSPVQISKRLAVSLSNLSYHIRVLNELDVLRLEDTQPVRGSLMHLYRLPAEVKKSKLVRDALAMDES